MSVELIKKPITLDEMTKKESVQVIKERDLIVPDGKPDMQSIAQLDGKINMDQIDVTQDRIVYRGTVNLCILYRTVNNPKCIYTMKGTIPVEDFVIMEGVNKDQKIDFNYEIEHISYSILNERKLNVKVIMQVDVKATGCKETTVITDIKAEGPIQTKAEGIEIVSLCNEKEEKVIVKEDLTVAQSKPCIGEIIKSNMQIKEDQVKRTDNEIKFNGMVEITTMYKVAGNDEEIEIITHRIPFEGSIENMKGDDEVFWNCSLSVTPSYMQVAPDYDGEDRVIECECIVTASYNTYNKCSYDTVSDIYCPGKNVKTKEKSLNYMNLADKVTITMPKKESIAIEDKPDQTVEVFSVDVKPTVEDKSIENGKLTLKGILEITTVFLIKGEDNNTIDTAVNIVPFMQEMDVKKVPEKTYVAPSVKAKDINVYAQTKRELIIEYLLECMAEVYGQNVLNVLEEIEMDDMSKEELDNYPSMTVYQVKKGDTLWSLAKRFNTTVKEIQEINDIDVPENLKEGQKIIILKKVKF